MQVSVEASGTIERKLTISVPFAEIDQKIENRLADVARKAKMPGFRPGKVPKKVIKQRYTPQVTHEVVTDTISSSYQQALGQENMQPAGLISIDPTPYEPGKDLEYTATIELFPDIPCPTLEGQSVEVPSCQVTPEDIDITLEEIRGRNADYETRDGGSQTGDRLTIDYTGRMEGEIVQHGQAEDYTLVLGKGETFPEFETGLTGVKTEETKTIACIFPDNHPDTALAGKEIVFSVHVKGVEKPVIPEPNDEFAVKMGIKEGGLAKLKEEIEASMNRELATKLRTDLRGRVMDALYSINQIEIPKSFLETELDRIVKITQERLSSMGLKDQDVDRDDYVETAKKNVTLSLVAQEIIKKFAIQLDAAKVRARVEEMASGYEDAEAFVNWYYSDKASLERLEAEVLEEQLVETVLDTADRQDKTVSFQEFMRPQQAD